MLKVFRTSRKVLSFKQADDDYFFHRRSNWKEYVVFNFLSKQPERCSTVLKWALSLDAGLGSGNAADNNLSVYILHAANDNTKNNTNHVNLVLLEGLGEFATGQLPNLDLNLPAPMITSALDAAGKQELKSGGKSTLTVLGTNLVGKYLLVSKNGKKEIDAATVTVDVPNGAKDSLGTLTKTIVTFDLTNEAAGKGFQFMIRNATDKAVRPDYTIK